MDNNFILKNLLDRLVMHYITIQNKLEQEIQRIEHELIELEPKIKEYEEEQVKKEVEEKQSEQNNIYIQIFDGKYGSRKKILDNEDFEKTLLDPPLDYQQEKENLLELVEMLKKSKLYYMNYLLSYINLLFCGLNLLDEEKKIYIELLSSKLLKCDSNHDLKELLFKMLNLLNKMNNHDFLKIIFDKYDIAHNKKESIEEVNRQLKLLDEEYEKPKEKINNDNIKNLKYLIKDNRNYIYWCNKFLGENLLSLFNGINAEELKLYIKALASVIELTPEEIKQVEDTLGEKLEQNKTFK